MVPGRGSCSVRLSAMQVELRDIFSQPRMIQPDVLLNPCGPKFKPQLIKITENTKFSYLVTLATLQVLNSLTWLVDTVLGSMSSRKF